MITSPKKKMEPEATDTFSKDIKKPNARYPPKPNAGYPPHFSEMQYPVSSSSEFPTHAAPWPVASGAPYFNPYAGVWHPHFSPMGDGFVAPPPGWTTNNMPMEARDNIEAGLQQTLPSHEESEEIPSKVPSKIPSKKPGNDAHAGSSSSDEKYPDENSRQRLYIDRVQDWDVLCGRGGKSNHHPGNKIYRQVVDEMKLKYKGTKGKKAKTEMSRAIVEHVSSYGGRFVKKEETTGRYFMLTQPEARKKTSQALREAKDLKIGNSMYDDGR